MSPWDGAPVPDVAAQLGIEPVAAGSAGCVAWCTLPAPLWGAVNGYVRLPLRHPWCGRQLDDLGLDVEITYRDERGWIGFDTMHGHDWWPGMPDYWPAQPDDPDVTCWTPHLVAAVTRGIATDARLAIPVA